MDEPYYKIFIENVPWDGFGLFTGFMTGVVVPVILLLATFISAERAERRAREYADLLRRHDKQQAFRDNASHALELIFRSAHQLQSVTLRRKRVRTAVTRLHNGTIDKDGAALIAAYDETDIGLIQQQTDSFVELSSAIHRVGHVLHDIGSDDVKEAATTILRATHTSSGITTVMLDDVVNAINGLYDEIITNPERWLNHHDHE